MARSRFSPLQCVAAPGQWAAQLGYSRAVRDGDDVWVSATAPVDAEGRLVGEGDPYAQAGHILTTIGEALRELGCRLADVRRTRIYLRSFDDLQEIGRAHGEAFPVCPPACTLIAVADLVLPGMRVYIEAEARAGAVQ